MNKEYKQWKKILATPIVLVVFGLLAYVGTFLLANVVFNLLAQLKTIFSLGKEFLFTDSVDWSPVFNGTLFNLNTMRPFFPFGYLLIFVFLTFFIPKRLYEQRMAFKDINKGTKGTQKLTTPEQLPVQYKKVRLDDNEYEGESGNPVCGVTEIEGTGENKKEVSYVYIDTNKTSSLVIGGTQSGKTETFSYPLLDLIMRAKVKDSVIVNDLKGDLLKNTKAEFERFGYDVYCLNLVEPENGIRFNPLELVKKAYIKKDFTKAQMLANSLSFSLYHNPNSKEPMWEEASISLLNALILAICDIGVTSGHTECINMYAVTSMLEELGAYPDEKGYTALDSFFENLPVTNVARKQYGTIKFSQGVTRSGIFTGTMAKLKNYTYDAIAKLTAENDLDLEEIGFGDRPVAVFIVYPDWNDSNYTIISTFLSQLNEVLSEKATLSEGSQTKRKVRYLLEEAANIPAIDGLSRAVNLGLSRGLIYHFVLQSYAQFDDKYGEKMSKAITGACGNQYYIMSDEQEDAEYFSRKLGKKTVIEVVRSGDPLSRDKSYSESEGERDVIDANELRGIEPGEWLMLRTKKRRDLKGNRIKPTAIFANYKDGTQMKHRYEYLLHRFDNPAPISSMNLGKDHKEIELDKIIVKFKQKLVDVEETYEDDTEKHEDFKFEEAIKVPLSMSNKDEYPQSVTLAKSIVKPKKGIKNKSLTERTVEQMMLDIDGIDEKETLINEVLTEDKFTFMSKKVKESITEAEYNQFSKLETIEQVSSFFNSQERAELNDLWLRMIQPIV